MTPRQFLSISSVSEEVAIPKQRASQSRRGGDGRRSEMLLRLFDDDRADLAARIARPRPLLSLHVPPQRRPNLAILVEERSQGRVLASSRPHDRRIHLLHGTSDVDLS